jgi:serine phosphatase RsbU (regulator of sigma subunit)
VYLGIHAVNVYVRDQETSLRFFVDLLGFQVAFDARLQKGDRWIAVSPPDGSAVLSLVVPSGDPAESALVGRPTGIVIAAEDVIAKYTEWRQRGVKFLMAPRLRRVRFEGLEDSAWGGVFTQFYDVDGNTFSLVAIDEVNREIEAKRRYDAAKKEAERRAEQELQIAKQVQARLFPQCLPEIDTLDYAGACIQARQVGGDYYDFLDLGRGRFGLVIGDISGKGIAAALLMANLQANLRSQSAIALDEPERLLGSVNRLFHQNTAQSSYATLFFAEYDAASRNIRYSNCGHLPALVLRQDGEVHRLDSTCTVMGLFEKLDCPIEQFALNPGDTLALYTDGVTESPNNSGEDFGEHRLIEALRECRDLSPKCAIDAILGEVQRFSPTEQFDDVTVIVARCK